MARTKRFQNLVTAGRLTLPAAILISATCWLLTALLVPHIEVQASHYSFWDSFGCTSLPLWANRLISFTLYSIIGYFLIELNNVYAIIRMRASVQTTVYFLLIAVCPSIHVLYAGDLAAAMYLVSLFFLFKSYQQARPEGALFSAFVFLGLGSLFFPQLMFFAPIFWIGAYHFRALRLRSFFASLVGWSMPYWFVLGYAYWHNRMEVFYRPFSQLAEFHPIRFSFEWWEVATIGYLLMLFIVGSVHCLVAGYQDKIRTRSYLHFLIFLNLCIFLFIGLQPVLSVHLLPLLLIGISILTGHLFALTGSRTSNVFFIATFVLLFLLFGFNIWMLS